MLHAFTSITANYIPKARVLAHSLRKHHTNIQFHIIFCDVLPAHIRVEDEPFDSIILIEELPIPHREAWIFKHSLVELCTAVKGFAFLEIISRYKAGKILYFDPDIVIMSSLEKLIERLDHSSLLLTPHQTVPERSEGAIIDNEICSLKHGIYNLGFLGVKSNREGVRFLNWWKDRLYEYCYDDKAGGLFTDQRWIDLVPAFFPDFCIVRDPGCNVATWNLSSRKATGTMRSGIMINGEPLVFFHFSGIDSGDQKIMLKKYIGSSHVLKELRNWYVRECSEREKGEETSLPFAYATYDNGQSISAHERLLYRSREDLQATFSNPFKTSDIDTSYFHWYQVHVPANERGSGGDNDTPDSLRIELSKCREEMNKIHNSLTWRIMRILDRIYRKFI